MSLSSRSKSCCCEFESGPSGSTTVTMDEGFLFDSDDDHVDAASNFNDDVDIIQMSDDDAGADAAAPARNEKTVPLTKYMRLKKDWHRLVRQIKKRPARVESC